jgi:N-acetylmuramoyl-L-alanine amidase
MLSNKTNNFLVILFTVILVSTCIKAVVPNKATENEPVVNQVYNINNTYQYDVSILSVDTSSTESEEEDSIEVLHTESEVEAETQKLIEVTEAETVEETTQQDSNGYSDNDIYLLARIVMAEAEGENMLCKKYIAQTVLNRVASDQFPNTIKKVIFQKKQFTPISDGRWDRVEPNDDCYEAVYSVISSSEPIIDSLYFECCTGDSWHARNLKLVGEAGVTRFYK